MIPPTIDAASLPPATFLRLELFPADVSGLSTELPAGDLKVYATDTHLLILANSSTGPFLWLSAPLLDYTPFNKTTRTWNVTLEGGEEVAISRSTSCGCGSRLRGVRLYPKAPHFSR